MALDLFDGTLAVLKGAPHVPRPPCTEPRSNNRFPHVKESEVCRHHGLAPQIELVNPEITVLLGRAPLRNSWGSKEPSRNCMANSSAKTDACTWSNTILRRDVIPRGQGDAAAGLPADQTSREAIELCNG
jgi:hypothetical protein